MTDAAETAAIADYAANPPLLQRKRLRLVRHAPASAPLLRGQASQAPAFEMRMPAGDWTPLAWDASLNRYALDVWQDIAVHREDAVDCDAGRPREPRRQLVVQSRHVPCPRPAASGGGTNGDRSSSRWRRGRGAVRRRARLSRRHRRIGTPAGGPPGARSVRRADVRRRRQVLDVAHHRTNRLQRGTARRHVEGEPIAVANGRFDFDAINSMAVFQGLLHIATNTRGWFALPVDSAALERLSRPMHASIAPLDVTKLYGNRDPDEPELCLQGADGQFARLSPTARAGERKAVPVLAARTGFWRYTRDGSTLRVLPAAGAARPASVASSMDGSPTK